MNIAHFVEFELQIIALSWLVVLYSIKAFQLSRLPMPYERAPRKGAPAPGIFRVYANMFMPWTMESTKRHPWRWLEFAAYHVGAFIAILNTFTTPFAPGLMTPGVRLAFAILIAPALILGVVKLARRITSPVLRQVNNFDDYFSLITLELFFFSGIMALLLNSVGWNNTYFIITAFFLFYVPFSKISHYVYFFFAGVITGSRYGWRGANPQPGRAQ